MAQWWRFRNKRGVFFGLLLPTAFFIALIGVIINDAGHLVAAQVRAESVARAAAAAGADTWFRTHRDDLAKRDALTAAHQKDPTATVLWIEIDQRTGSVTVRVEKMATTLAVERIAFLDQYVAQGATESDVRTS
jgi:hypothetical protein